MKRKPSFLFHLLTLVSLLAVCFVPFAVAAANALDTIPAVTDGALMAQAAPTIPTAPDTIADGAATASPTLNLWQGLIPIAAPILVWLIKSFVPKIPKGWLPVICICSGFVLDLILHFLGLSPGNGWVAVALGAAGVAVRELKDQAGKALTSPAPPPAYLH